MDMRMPAIDKLETARQIKAAPEGDKTIIVAQTSLAFEDDCTRIIAASCDDYICKPFQETE